MNHAYRLIWSEARQGYVAVAEVARARGKRSAAALALCAAFLAVPPAPTFAANLPEGGRIVAGTGSISQSGNTLTVTQSSAKLAANWQSFSIGQGYAVEFVQPSVSAVALNRVLGSDVSVIQGALRANGQVFLINPNGVLFTPTAQVEVGGLVASTLNLSNEDFLAGRLRFAGDSGNSVINQGNIETAPGGTVALIAAKIENTGRIEAPRGNVLMGAGNQVTLDLGGPVRIQVEEGALNALIQQGGAIKADGGYVYLTAKAANDLASAAINHTGITEARRLATGEKGEIWLMGDMAHGQVNVAGTLDASGGFIETSAAKVKVADGAQIKAGHWLIDPNDFTIAAAGGDITGATLSASLAGGDVTIQSASGATSGNGDIFVRDDVTWSSGRTLTLSAHRNIEILATLDASAGSGGKVALEYGQGAPASGNTATYTFGLTGSGFTGKINLQAGNNFTTKLGSDGSVDNWTVITSLGSQGDESTGPANSLQGLAYSGKLSGNYVLGADIDASATSGWNSGAGFVPIGNDTNPFTGRFDGLGHVITNLTINRPATDYVGLFGYASGGDIRNVGLANGSVSGSSVVGGLVGGSTGTVSHSYATGSVMGGNWVGGLVGGSTGTVSHSYATGSVMGGNFVGGLAGGNDHSITNSYATGSVTGGDYVGGLVGRNVTGTVGQSNATGDVTGNSHVGGLVGGDVFGMVSQSYATGSVTGSDYVGGLVGSTSGMVSQSYATGAVTGSGSVGGLVGLNGGTVSQSYATGSVNSYGNWVGGLVGYNQYGTVSESYATGSVMGNEVVGGLVGWNDGIVDKSYATGSVTGSDYVGGLVGVVWIFGMVTASFWDTQTSGQATSAGGTGRTTTQMQSLATFTAAGWDIDDAGGTGKVWRIYDGQSYPLLRSFLTPLTATANSGSRVYDGTTSSPFGVSYSTTPNSNLLGTPTVTASSKDVGSRTLTVSGLYSNQAGYDISYVTGTLTITPKALSITGTTVANKTYDGTAYAAVTPGTLSGFVGSETVNVSATGAFDDKNAGTGKTVTVAYTLSDGANGGLASNYTLAGTTHTADITPKSLTASYSATSKVYDGTTAATVSATSGDVVTGDAVTIAASGTFADKNVGTGKSVSISGGSLSGADAGNYTLANPTGSATADITPKTLTVSGITAANKVYDGTTSATVSYGDSNFAGLISGDTVTASGAFADKNVGTGKTVHLTFGGADAGNYSFGGQSTASADITPRPVQVTADAKSKFVGQSDPSLTYATGCPTGMSTDCGLVSGETLAGSLSRDAGEAVGAYAIRQGTVTDANNPNYAISYQGADLTIAASSGGGGGSSGGSMSDAPGSALASAQQTASGGAGTAPTPTPEPSAGSNEAAGGPLLAALVRVEEPGIRLPEGFVMDEDERNRHR